MGRRINLQYRGGSRREYYIKWNLGVYAAECFEGSKIVISQCPVEMVHKVAARTPLPEWLPHFLWHCDLNLYSGPQEVPPHVSPCIMCDAIVTLGFGRTCTADDADSVGCAKCSAVFHVSCAGFLAIRKRIQMGSPYVCIACAG